MQPQHCPSGEPNNPNPLERVVQRRSLVLVLLPLPLPLRLECLALGDDLLHHLGGGGGRGSTGVERARDWRCAVCQACTARPGAMQAARCLSKPTVLPAPKVLVQRQARHPSARHSPPSCSSCAAAPRPPPPRRPRRRPPFARTGRRQSGSRASAQHPGGRPPPRPSPSPAGKKGAEARRQVGARGQAAGGAQGLAAGCRCRGFADRAVPGRQSSPLPGKHSSVAQGTANAAQAAHLAPLHVVQLSQRAAKVRQLLARPRALAVLFRQLRAGRGRCMPRGRSVRPARSVSRPLASPCWPAPRGDAAAPNAALPAPPSPPAARSHCHARPPAASPQTWTLRAP